MIYPGKIRQIKVIAVITAVIVTVVSLGISGNVLAETKMASVFEASFSGLKNGTVSTSDAETVEALEKNFFIYNSQRASQTSHTSYFERNDVNGYLITESGSQGKPKYPDTGVYPAWDLDGYGTAEDKPIPMWSIEDGWLSCNAYDGDGAFLFRQGNLLYVKDDNSASGFAAVKNFKLETGFKFSSTGENDALAVIFHAKDVGLVAQPYQCLLTFNADGKLFFGKPIHFEGAINYNNTLQAKNGGSVKFEKDHEYSLSLVVIGTKLTLTIKDGKTVICEYENADVPSTGFETGFIAVGMSNNGPAVADVKVERLDDSGEAVDFSTPLPGYDFGFVATTFCNYRTYYYADIGNGPQLFEGNWYIRDKGKDLYWLDFWSTRRGSTCWVGDGMNDANELLTGMFETYHEQISVPNHTRLFAKSSKYSDRIGAELWLGDGQTSAQGYVDGGNRLLLLGDPREHKLMSQMMTIAPKTSGGSQVLTKNFETNFGAILFNDPEKAIALSFRSGSTGAMMNDEATAGYPDKVTVLFSGAGYKIVDGAGLATSGNTLIPWNNGATFNGTNAHIYVKVINNEVTIRVTDDSGNVYLDNSAAPNRISTVRNGYCYYTSMDGYGYILYMGLNRLNDSGKKIDFNKNPTVEITSTDCPSLTAEIDRSKGQDLIDVGMLDEVVGTTKDGYKFKVRIKWLSDNYRSYKDGTFDFAAEPVSDEFTFAANAQPTAKITNKINGDYDTATSRKYYFDSESDLRDFVCHLSSVDFTGKSKVDNFGTYYEPIMTKVDPTKCWKIENGRITSSFTGTAKSAYNGLNRARDLSTMVLEDEDFSLINYQVDIDYTHGTDYWYSYVLTSVQDSSKLFGNVYTYAGSSDLVNGTNTDFGSSEESKKGGVYTYLEDNGTFQIWGGIKPGSYDHIFYSSPFDESNTFFSTYDRNKQHHMTIRVLDNKMSVRVDGSEVYLAELDDAIYGGFTGFASYGNKVTFDNLTITALDDSGNPTALKNAKKGIASDWAGDTYSGWQPLDSDWFFNWLKPYTD